MAHTRNARRESAYAFALATILFLTPCARSSLAAPEEGVAYPMDVRAALAFFDIEPPQAIPEDAWASIPDKLDATWIRALAKVTRHGPGARWRRALHEYASRRETANPILDRLFADPEEPNRDILLTMRTTDSGIAPAEHASNASPALFFGDARRKAALSLLVDAFADGDPKVRRTAVYAAWHRVEWANAGPETAARYEGFDWDRLERAAMTLLADKHPQTRGYAAEILGKRRHVAARKPIIEMAGNDDDDWARAAGTRALRSYPPSEDAFLLLRRATRDNYCYVRYSAIQAMLRYGERGEEVVCSLPEDRHWEVREAQRFVARAIKTRHARREEAKHQRGAKP